MPLVASFRSCLLLLCLPLWFLSHAALAQEQAAPPKVSIAAAYSKEIVEEATFIGEGEAIDRVDIVARVSGFVEAALVEDGARVEKDDILFQIESDSYSATLAARKADLAKAEADLGKALGDALTHRIGKVIPVLPVALIARVFLEAGLITTVTGGIMALAWSGGAVWPSGRAWLYLGLTTGIGVIAYNALTGAMRHGEISVVAPFRYTRLVFAMALGILVFGERPDSWTLLGSAVIVTSGFFTLIRSSRR